MRLDVLCLKSLIEPPRAALPIQRDSLSEQVVTGQPLGIFRVIDAAGLWRRVPRSTTRSTCTRCAGGRGERFALLPHDGGDRLVAGLSGLLALAIFSRRGISLVGVLIFSS